MAHAWMSRGACVARIINLPAECFLAAEMWQRTTAHAMDGKNQTPWCRRASTQSGTVPDKAIQAPAKADVPAWSQKAHTDSHKTLRWRMVDSGDMRIINESDGKVGSSTKPEMIPALTAQPWPQMLVSSHGQKDEDLSKLPTGVHARVVLASYRASAEKYLSEWREVVSEAFLEYPDVELVELGVCDLAICKVWPFKGLLLGASKPSKAQPGLSKLHPRRVHYFGPEQVATQSLAMENRLTGYVFVVDGDGRIRWRSSGRMLEEEAHSLLKTVRKLAEAPRGGEHHD